MIEPVETNSSPSAPTSRRNARGSPPAVGPVPARLPRIETSTVAMRWKRPRLCFRYARAGGARPLEMPAQARDAAARAVVEPGQHDRTAGEAEVPRLRWRGSREARDRRNYGCAWVGRDPDDPRP